MTLCSRLSDQMVDVAHGRSAWTSDESAHLDTCADCAAEWRLVTRALGLGSRLPVPDMELVADRVRERLVSEPAGVLRFRRWRAARWVVGVAVAAALLFAVRSAIRSRDQGPAASVSVLQELDELTTTELEKVWRDLGADGMPADATGLGDLDANELERVLRSWEDTKA